MSLLLKSPPAIYTEGNSSKVRYMCPLPLPTFIAVQDSKQFKLIRALLLAAEDNMNVQLKDITVTARDGRVSHLDQVYIRGSHVKFFIVPDMLRCVSFIIRA